MDILTKLTEQANLSGGKLQFIISAWVFGSLFESKKKVSQNSGRVEEDDYNKQSIYSILYSIYRSVGTTKDENGQPFEFTFNTWGYAWPDGREGKLTTEKDPQRFGMNAYTGLYDFPKVRKLISKKKGAVNIVEMGCGTGAGAHHVCKNVLPNCTYTAIDMQKAAIETCKRKFIPDLGGRLQAIHGDATKLSLPKDSADIVAICETHVTEIAGGVTDEDKAFFNAMKSVLKKDGFLVWGNAIPDSTWQPCFDYLKSMGMKQVEVRDVTKEAILARDQDLERVNLFVDRLLNKFIGFRIPFIGRHRRKDAEMAIKNFYRHPGTDLYDAMISREDTYKVVLFQKA